MKPILSPQTQSTLSILLTAKSRLCGATLLPGARASVLHQAESTLGVALPAQVRALFRLHDGGGGSLRLDGHDLLSLEQMVQLWRTWRDLKDKGLLEGLRGRPGPGVRPDFWQPRWIPFTFGIHSAHCLDLDPAPGGEAGQVILLLEADDRRPLVAPDLLSFLRQARWSAAPEAPPAIRWSPYWTRHLFESTRTHFEHKALVASEAPPPLGSGIAVGGGEPAA